MSSVEVLPMSELPEKTYAKSLAKGLLAGVIGGLVATAAKAFAEGLYPPQTPGDPAPPAVRLYAPKRRGEPEPPAVLAEKIAGHSLVESEKVTVEEAIHWGFGAMTGAAYGVLAEYFPAATVKDGAGFGMGLDSLTHGPPLPATGLRGDPG